MFRNIDSNGVDRTDDKLKIEHKLSELKMQYGLEHIGYTEYTEELRNLMREYDKIIAECKGVKSE